MIQSKEMNNRSKVTKRQKVLLTSEMYFFSAVSYESTLTEAGMPLTDPTPLPVNRESMLLLLSIAGHAFWAGQAPPTSQVWKDLLGVSGRSLRQEARLVFVNVDSICGCKPLHCICRKNRERKCLYSQIFIFLLLFGLHISLNSGWLVSNICGLTSRLKQQQLWVRTYWSSTF